MIPWFQYTAVQLGPVPIQVWGFFVALGMAVSMWIVWRRAKRLEENPEQMFDLAFWAIVGGLFGARLFHILLYQPGFYFENPVEIIKVWHGGLSSFGGLFGAIAGFIWKYVRVTNIANLRIRTSVPFVIRMLNSARNDRKLLRVADILAFAAVYGWMIGRIGCVMIHDHPGAPCNCFLSVQWPDGTPRFDMALLEIIAMMPLAIWFLFKSRKPSPSRRGKGEVSNGWYLNTLFIYYGALRFTLDFFRATDIAGADARYLGLTPAQYFSIVLVILGIRFFYQRKTSSRA